MNSERIDATAETSFRPPPIDLPEGVKLAAASSLDQIKERFEAVRASLMACFDALTHSRRTSDRIRPLAGHRPSSLVLRRNEFRGESPPRRNGKWKLKGRPGGQAARLGNLLF